MDKVTPSYVYATPCPDDIHLAGEKPLLAAVQQPNGNRPAGSVVL